MQDSAMLVVAMQVQPSAYHWPTVQCTKVARSQVAYRSSRKRADCAHAASSRCRLWLHFSTEARSAPFARVQLFRNSQRIKRATVQLANSMYKYARSEIQFTLHLHQDFRQRRSRLEERHSVQHARSPFDSALTMRQEGHRTGATRIVFKKTAAKSRHEQACTVSKERERNIDENLKTQNARKTHSAEKCNVRTTSNYGI